MGWQLAVACFGQSGQLVLTRPVLPVLSSGMRPYGQLTHPTDKLPTVPGNVMPGSQQRLWVPAMRRNTLGC
jgi:hypothetical protein